MSGTFERLSPYVSQALGLSEADLLRAYRPALRSDLARILELRKAVNGDVYWDDRAFVEWRYFSRMTDGGDAPYWVFVRNDEIVGACGLEPVTLVIDGAPIPAVRTLDIMVRPDLDGLGLGAFMNLVLFRHFPIAMVTGSNERSHRLLMRMFHHTVDLRFWKIAIRARAVIDERVSLGALSTLIAPPADLLLAWRRLRSRVPVPAGVVIREINAFDSRVIELSRRCETHGRVLVRRTDEYLNWRFVRNPRVRYRIFAAFAADRLEGYLVTRLNLARPNPRRDAEIVDWLVAPESGGECAVLAALIQAGVDGLIRDRAGIVSCAAVSADMPAALESAGFRIRPAERLPFFVKAADARVHERLSAADSWFLTRGDFDVE